MKVTFLGTGAADWDINAYDTTNGFRRNSAVLINDDLLIDPGPHIFHYCEKSGQPDLLKNVRNIIVTHTHADHFNCENLMKLVEMTGCRLWGDRACMRKLIRELGPEKAQKIPFCETHVRQPLAYLIGNYSIWCLRSNHFTEDRDEATRLYLINDGKKILYYGCDSAWIPTESWNVIKTQKVNAMVLECTCGETAPDDWRIFEHNTLDMLELMLRMFRKYNYFAPDVKYYVSHMARTLHKSHEELAEYLKPLGVTPAYDGFTIEV